MQLTPEQIACIDATENTRNNLLITALAGASKTTTLVKMAEKIPGSILAIAFNKKIATEMAERLPARCTAKTLNAIGHGIWSDKLRKRLTLDNRKLGRLLTEAIREIDDPDFEEWAVDNYSSILEICSVSKNVGHLPDSFVEKYEGKVIPVMTNEEFLLEYPEDIPMQVFRLVLKILARSADEAMEGKIDFADQLLFPTVFRCLYPTYKTILVDEAQDLSELNHRMIAKLVKERIIAVGDPNQAIYAFRGAYANGMPLLAERFYMEKLSLNTTFRCAESICEHVRWHTPNIRAWENNPNNPGEVKLSEEWQLSDIPDGSAVICRNNAPLFNLAIKLIKSGRSPYLWGQDIGKSMMLLMNKLGKKNTTREDALIALKKIEDEQVAKSRSEKHAANIVDKMDCIRLFLNSASSLGGAMEFANRVLNSSGKIDLCTGHKSKGAEWQDIFFLDQHLIKFDEDHDGQEKNLHYVICTRAKRSITYIETTKMEG